MKSLLLNLLLLICICAGAQDMEKYRALANEAFKLYEAKKYLESATKYNEAFAAIGYKGYADDRYNAACSWAMAGLIDSSFTQLYKIAERTKYSNLHHISIDPDLDTLHKDPRWPKLIEIVAANKKEKEKDLDQALVARLDSIYHDDQDGRLKLRDLEKKYGNGSKEMAEQWKIISQKDSVNLIKVTHILDTRGWLGPKEIGETGSTTLFLVIQHAGLKVQEKYLPMMREAVKNNKANASSLALLEDRVALGQGKKQIYGSQIKYDQVSGAYYVAPLDDPDNVDKRRFAVGLGSLGDYVKNWDIVWDVEAYKKALPELEKKQLSR